jgi:thioredoxin
MIIFTPAANGIFSKGIEHLIGRKASMAGTNTLEFTDQNFAQEVLSSDKPVIVDFWATWCPPCRMMSPTVDSIADEYAGRAKVGKLNVDDNQNVASQYNIRGIPTLLLFKNGQILEQVVGATSKDNIVKLLQKHL